MFESPFKTHDMLLVLRISLFELVQNLGFFQASLVPVKHHECTKYYIYAPEHLHRLLASNDLNGYFLTGISDLAVQYTSAYNVGKHSFTERREDLVPTTIELLTEDDLIVTLRIRSRVQSSGNECRCSRFLLQPG